MKKAIKSSETIIYDNYDLAETYTDDYIIDELMEMDPDMNKDEISDDIIWKERYFLDEFKWDEVWTQLTDFFGNATVIFFGSTGLWHGTYQGASMGDFEKVWYDATKDCDYVRLVDEDGHLYLECSHHDGTNSYEIKIVTEKGIDIYDQWDYDDWEENFEEPETESEVYTLIIDKYSELPYFAKEVYGV